MFKFKNDINKLEFGWYSIDPPTPMCTEELKREIDNRVEYALRHLVKPVIKGNITRGKIRWRGLTLSYIVSDDDCYQTRLTDNGKSDSLVICGHVVHERVLKTELFINLMQRGQLIHLNFDKETEERYNEWLKKKPVSVTG